MALTYSFEAQDINTSGWDVSSTSSNVTLSFWVKSSVAQQFQVNVRLYGPSDANQREFAFEYTPTGADTWTKVTKTIPGHASNTIRADNASGMFIQFPTFYGTNYTNNARNFDTWEAKNNAQNYKDYVSTWYTTNDATWEITGLQLEVGAEATEFDRKLFGEELRTCQRYYEKLVVKSGTSSLAGVVAVGQNIASRKTFGPIGFKVEKRAAPTVANVTIGIDAGDTTHTFSFGASTWGVVGVSTTSTDIGEADSLEGDFNIIAESEL